MFKLHIQGDNGSKAASIHFLFKKNIFVNVQINGKICQMCYLSQLIPR